MLAEARPGSRAGGGSGAVAHGSSGVDHLYVGRRVTRCTHFAIPARVVLPSSMAFLDHMQIGPQRKGPLPDRVMSQTQRQRPSASRRGGDSRRRPFRLTRRRPCESRLYGSWCVSIDVLAYRETWLHRVLWLVCADARQREQELLWAASSTLHAQEQGGVGEVASAEEARRGEGEGEDGRGCCIVIDSLQTFYDVASGDADAVRGGIANPYPAGLERMGRSTQHRGRNSIVRGTV